MQPQKNTIDVTRPLLSATWSNWINCKTYEFSTPTDRLTAICNYAEVKGSLELTEAEVERIVWAVEEIRSNAALLDDANNGELVMFPRWCYDPLHEEVRSLGADFFGRSDDNLMLAMRKRIGVQSLLLSVIEDGARVSLQEAKA